MRLSSFTRGRQLTELVPEGPTVETIGILPGSEIPVKSLPHTTWLEYCCGTTGPWIGRCTLPTLSTLGCFEGEWVLAQFGSQARALRLCTLENTSDIADISGSEGEDASVERRPRDDGVLYLRSEALHLIGHETQRYSVHICRQSPPCFDEQPPLPTADVVVLERVRRAGSSGRRSYGKQVESMSENALRRQVPPEL